MKFYEFVTSRRIKLNLNKKELAKKAMAELLRRQADGDNFPFEIYIDEQVAAAPKPTITVDSISGMDSVMSLLKTMSFQMARDKNE